MDEGERGDGETGVEGDEVNDVRMRMRCCFGAVVVVVVVVESGTTNAQSHCLEVILSAAVSLGRIAAPPPSERRRRWRAPGCASKRQSTPARGGTNPGDRSCSTAANTTIRRQLGIRTLDAK